MIHEGKIQIYIHLKKKSKKPNQRGIYKYCEYELHHISRFLKYHKYKFIENLYLEKALNIFR